VAAWASFLGVTLPLVEQRLAAQGQAPPSTITVLWCKFAEGKLRFTIGDRSTDLPFSGWARTLRPPPFVCPHTGVRTFHLARTDDGRIAASEQILRCEVSGRRALRSEMAVCAMTGKTVLAELTRTCSVTGARVLAADMATCAMCGQQVSPTAIRKDRCSACRGLRPVGKADPRMARVLHEHPALDRWGGWRISETAAVYILTANGWIKRLLVVVDKDSLELKLLARGNRFLPHWDYVEPQQHGFVLRE